MTRAISALVLCILAGGAFAVTRTYETAIAARRTSMESYYERTIANRRTIAHASALRAVERVARKELDALGAARSASEGRGALLSVLERCGAATGVQIFGIDPDGNQAGLAPSENGLFPEMRLTLRVRGRFQNILRFMQDLSHHQRLVEISNVRLSVASSGSTAGSEPALDAVLSAIEYRFEMPPSAGSARFASAR